MISLSPSITCETSSGEARPRRLPIRSTARVRTWLILTQERFGSLEETSSSVSGKPARCGWLCTFEPKLLQIELFDVRVHHPHRVVFSDVVVEALRKQRDLRSVRSLDESLHHSSR